MPSLRQRVSTYFRQLSFIAEPRERETQVNDGSFMTRYLEGCAEPLPTCPIFSGKDPSDMPILSISNYDTDLGSILACTGPSEGLCGIKRKKLHLSAGPDIDFIDAIESAEDIRQLATSSSRLLYRGQRSNSGTRVGDQNANQSCKIIARGSVSRKSSIVSLKEGNTAAKLLNQCDEESNVEKDSVNKNLKRIQDIEEDTENTVSSPIEGVSNWNATNDDVYGIAISLYEKNVLTNEYTGSPIADCFGIVARSNCAMMALADGVNWGENARVAARSSIFGCLEYLETAIFGKSPSGIATTTIEVFVSLLRSFSQAHNCILENNGALSTLTCAVILPLAEENTGKFVVCCCSAGDSLGYVFSKVNGVREFTQGSHDISANRDMRDALGALGPVNGSKPELGNLTLSLTVVERGDIVFLTSDGISDNFDPVVGKFAEPLTEEHRRKLLQHFEPPTTSSKRHVKHSSSTSSRRPEQLQTPNPGITGETPVRPPRKKNGHSTVTKLETPASIVRPKYLRSHTFIEPRRGRAPKSTPHSNILRSEAGLPLVTGAQRHALSLLRLNDLLMNGINGSSIRPCDTAKHLCLLLIDFVRILTTAKRTVLEQRENFYKTVTNEQGVRKEVEMNKNQQRIARKKVVNGGIFSTLPGKLDHASCCAFKIPTEDTINNPNYPETNLPNYTETNF